MIDFCLQSHRPILYLKRQQKVHPAKRFEILRPRQHGLLVMRSAIAMHWFGQRVRSYVFVALFIYSLLVDHKVSHRVGLVMLSVTYISHFDQMHQASQVI